MKCKNFTISLISKVFLTNDCRIGEELSCKLYLSRVDEFGNPKKFEECPRDIECGIFTMEDRQIKLASNMTNFMPTDNSLYLEIPVLNLT